MSLLKQFPAKIEQQYQNTPVYSLDLTRIFRFFFSKFNYALNEEHSELVVYVKTKSYRGFKGITKKNLSNTFSTHGSK